LDIKKFETLFRILGNSFGFFGIKELNNATKEIKEIIVAKEASEQKENKEVFL